MNQTSRRAVTRTALLLALGAAVLVAMLALPAVTQPEPAVPGERGEPGPPPGGFGIDQLHAQTMGQLADIWTRMLQGIAENPEFLESPEAQPLMQRMDALRMISHEMHEALQPGAMEPGPEANGRFEFVEWLQPGALYRVLDTRTGELQMREAPPIQE